MTYDPIVVVAFVDTYVDVDPDTRERWINGVLCSPNDTKTLHRWRTTAKGVSLDAIDEFLMRHDLMLWELEHWAEEQGLSALLPEPEPPKRRPRARSGPRRPAQPRRDTRQRA